MAVATIICLSYRDNHVHVVVIHLSDLAGETIMQDSAGMHKRTNQTLVNAQEAPMRMLLEPCCEDMYTLKALSLHETVQETLSHPSIVPLY